MNKIFTDLTSFFSLSVICLGSNLKFKLTEFGTLEIVSTVETENGECELSTPTQHRKTSENEADKKSQKSPNRGNCQITGVVRERNSKLGSWAACDFN